MTVCERVEQIRKNVADACAQCSRQTSEISIVAATKTVEKQRINELKGCNITILGENRVQEFCSKYESDDGFEWHFIGALQTNKVKNIIGKASLIHSLDRTSLADEIEKQSVKAGINTNVLIEVNMGAEITKSGVAPSELDKLYNYTKQKPHITIKGFMAVMPRHASTSLYKIFQEIFEIYKAKDSSISILSVGMSEDYMLAIKYGANMIRLGSAIFGQR